MLPCATKVVTWNKNINKQINVATQSNGYHMMKKHTITHAQDVLIMLTICQISIILTIHNTRHGLDISYIIHYIH